jgi:hypothetical protein
VKIVQAIDSGLTVIPRSRLREFVEQVLAGPHDR